MLCHTAMIFNKLEYSILLFFFFPPTQNKTEAKVTNQELERKAANRENSKSEETTPRKIESNKNNNNDNVKMERPTSRRVGENTNNNDNSKMEGPTARKGGNISSSNSNGNGYSSKIDETPVKNKMEVLTTSTSDEISKESAEQTR